MIIHTVCKHFKGDVLVVVVVVFLFFCMCAFGLFDHVQK